MKRFLRLIPVALLAMTAGFALTSCDDDDDDKDQVIAVTQLPSQAKNFIAQYFPETDIVSAKMDKTEYEVILNTGVRIDFTLTGEWTDVDAPEGFTVPSGFYPSAIDDYLAANYPVADINEISRQVRGYDVELVNGVELIFGPDGSFIGVDR